MIRGKSLSLIVCSLVVLMVVASAFPVLMAQQPENVMEKGGHGGLLMDVIKKMHGRKLKPVNPGMELRIGRYHLVVTESGVESLKYLNSSIVSSANLGTFIKGWTFDNFLYVLFTRGAITINHDIITLMMKNSTVLLDESVKIRQGHMFTVIISNGNTFLVKYGGHMTLNNSTLSGTGIIVVQPVPKLKERLISYMAIKFEITDSGIENIKVGNVSVGSILFNPGSFVGSVGRLNEVYIWENARAHVVSMLHGKLFDVLAENITFVPAKDIELKAVTPSIVILVFENRTFGIIAGKITVENGVIKAEKALRVIVGPGLMEHWLRERHRYHQIFKVNASGEFSGRYISGILENGTIYNYTVRGTIVASSIDLTELLGNEYAVTRHGCTIGIISGNNRVKIVDVSAGPIIVRTPTGGTVIIELPDDNVTVANITENFIKYYVDNSPVIVRVYNGSLALMGDVLTVSLGNNSCMALVAPPSEEATAQAFIKVFDNGSMRAAGESTRPDVNINVDVSNGRVIAHISGEGQGTLVDVEIDPSVSLSLENLNDLKVTFDGKELQLKSLDEVLNTGNGFAITFDGASYHVIVPVEHFSEHTLEILMPQATTPLTTGGGEAQTPQESPSEETSGHGAMGGLNPMIIAAVLVLVGIVVLVGALTRR